MCTNLPAPPAHQSRPVSGVPAATLGGRRAHRNGAAPGTRRQGLPRPLPAGQDGRRAAASRPTDQHAAGAAALAREVARWITTAPSRRGLHAAEGLRRLLEHCPELDRTHDLVRQFAAMLDARDAAPLPDWLEQLTTARLPALAGLAKAIRENQPAVVQGITTPFSSGVNEGRITDLKLQKRIMAGRAGVPLLRHRVILMALLRRRYP
ncbi:transposase [Streptomyces sp. NPDC050388]|uniref:transposase n=1 Tax=Streptomyces sp. NPDC050388 TaxID=3155781 RepID=UPI003428B30C